jgi:hypothetical protein
MEGEGGREIPEVKVFEKSESGEDLLVFSSSASVFLSRGGASSFCSFSSETTVEGSRFLDKRCFLPCDKSFPSARISRRRTLIFPCKKGLLLFLRGDGKNPPDAHTCDNVDI